MEKEVIHDDSSMIYTNLRGSTSIILHCPLQTAGKEDSGTIMSHHSCFEGTDRLSFDYRDQTGLKLDGGAFSEPINEVLQIVTKLSKMTEFTSSLQIVTTILLAFFILSSFKCQSRSLFTCYSALSRPRLNLIWPHSIILWFISSSPFVRSNKLIPSSITSDDFSGAAVAISSDYSYCMVGAPFYTVGSSSEQGAVFVFARNGTYWKEHQTVTSSDGENSDLFGYSVSSSGDYTVIGTTQDDTSYGNHGSVYVFFNNNSMLIEQTKLVASDAGSNDYMGWVVSIDGDYVLSGAVFSDVGGNSNQGSAYIFHRSVGSWSQQAKLTASDGAAFDQFGFSVSLSGDYALVGANYDEVIYSYQGSAYLYQRSGTLWSQIAKLFDEMGGGEDFFGFSLVLSGSYAFISARADTIGSNFQQGSVHVYHNNGTTWNHEAKIVRSDGDIYDNFGNSVSVSGDYLAVGTYMDDVTTGNQGSVTLFKRTGTTWNEISTLVAPDASPSDEFGGSVVLSPEFLIVGASRCDDGPAADSGAAYSFYNLSGVWEFVCDPGMGLIENSLCLPCELGKYKDFLGGTCLSCVAGRYSSLTGSLSCTSCEAGKYNGLTDQFACIDCPSGKYNSNTESTSNSSCLECTVGKYLPFSGADSSGDCIVCPIGTYGTLLGSDDDNECLPCNLILSGSSSPVGSSGSSSCVCPLSFLDDDGVCSCDVGFGYDGDSCVPCSQDSIKPDVSLSTCSSCKSGDPNSVSNDNSTDCICGIGFVMAGQDCVKCDGGMICDEEGSVLTSISLESGHWRESSTDLSIRECPYEDACTGSSDISNQCADGHSGPLCAVCEAGYTSANSNSACGKCFEDEHAAGFSLVIIVIIVLSVVIVAMMLQQGNDWLVSKLYLLRAYVNERDMRSRFRILLAYFQIIGSFTSVIASNLPANYTTFLTIAQSASLNFGSIFSPRCFNPSINFYDELSVQTIGPILVGIFILLIFIVSTITNPLNRDKARSRFLSRIFLSSFIFFPSASTSVFQIFNCDDDFESGSSYLKVDYRLECSGREYEGYVGYAILMIFVYPIGIPLFYFICLWFQRTGIMNGDDTRCSDEHIICLERDCSSVSCIRVDDYVNSSSLDICKRNMSQRLAIERACINAVTSPYSSLFGAYKPEYWYWECVECMRRLSLTGLLVFMYPGTDKQVLLAILICFFFMVLQTCIQPYLESSHSFFMISSQWGILLQLYGIYMIISNSFGDVTETIGGLAVGVGLMFACFGLVEIGKLVYGGGFKLKNGVTSVEMK